MKKFIFVFFLFGLISCNNYDYSNDYNHSVNNDKVIVKLSTNQYKESEEPLLRSISGSSDLYGFQVYRCDNTDSEYPETEYKVCYGIFDNISDIEIELSNKYKYNIEMVYLPNGKNLVYYHSSGCYELPFNEFFWNPTALNTVYYSESNNIYALNMICVNENDNNNRSSGYYRTDIDYYYGYLLNFVPKSNETITIDLKNMIWGLKLKAKRVEGENYNQLIVKINSRSNCPKTFYLNVNDDITEFVIPKILLGGSAENYYKDSSYEYFVDFSVGTEKNPFEIVNGSIGIKRNVMKVIEFNVTNDKTNSTINITTDNNEMTEEITKL